MNKIFYLIIILTFNSCGIMDALIDNKVVNSFKGSSSVYSLTYEGTKYNTSEQAFDYVLLEAGKICIANRDSFFTVHNLIQKDNITTNSDKQIVTRPYCSCSISTYKEKPSNNSNILYEANYLVNALKYKYNIKN